MTPSLGGNIVVRIYKMVQFTAQVSKYYSSRYLQCRDGMRRDAMAKEELLLQALGSKYATSAGCLRIHLCRVTNKHDDRCHRRDGKRGCILHKPLKRAQP